MLRFLAYLFTYLILLTPQQLTKLPDSKRAGDVRALVWPRLKKELNNKGLKIYAPIYIRIFKQEHLLEIWIKNGSQYHLFKVYQVCSFSGGLGTKTKSGDNKSPEGFYDIKPDQLYPSSTYHLAINIGYPNALEKLKGYTGDEIMIHGYCASIGCYAMTNPYIEDIYTLIYKAFESGRRDIQLDIYPFKMDKQHLEKYAQDPNFSFWNTMKPGFERFEKNHVPATAGAKGAEYYFNN